MLAERRGPPLLNVIQDSVIGPWHATGRYVPCECGVTREDSRGLDGARQPRGSGTRGVRVGHVRCAVDEHVAELLVLRKQGPQDVALYNQDLRRGSRQVSLGTRR